MKAPCQPTVLFRLCPYPLFHQLKRRDQVILYATVGGSVGSLVDYSGKRTHTKHTTISVIPLLAGFDPRTGM